MPLLTVIVPNFNHARFLQRRLDSIFNQTFQDFEVIILDDCSKDNSREIIETYRHRDKVKAIVYNETNSGSPFKQWAKGLAMVESEWVWIAESDDSCEPFFLEALIPAFSQPDCVLAYNEITWIDENNKILKSTNKLGPTWYEGKQFLQQKMLMQDYLVNAGMCAFRKSACKGVSNDWTNMLQAGDYWFWCEIARQGNVYASGQSLAYFVRHPNSSSVSHLYSITHLNESMAVLDKMVLRKSISSAHLHHYLKQQLIQLHTWKKGMAEEEYNTQIDYWQHQAAIRGLSLGNTELKAKAFLKKVQHRLR